MYAGDKASADLTVVCRKAKSSTTLAYKFGDGSWQSDNTYSATATTDTGVLTVKVSDAGDTSKVVTLEEVDFVWNAPAVNQPDNYKNGQKGAIVEMFGWHYADIEAECGALGKMGYMGLKVFPPQEAVITN